MKGIQTRLDISDPNNVSSHDPVAATYTGIYGMHKYWSKKPHNLIRNLILNNSQPGDIVLDPFCGSGISVIESIITKRKSIGIDINPMSIFITKQTLENISPEEFQFEFHKIEHDCKKIINELYAVKRKKQIFIGTHFVWNNNNLTEVWYKQQNKKIIEIPTNQDLKLAKSFSYSKINYYFPKSLLIQNSRINAKSKMHVYDLFTPRNALGLSILLNRIEKIKNKKLKDMFRFCFTASLGQASKMVFVINNRKKTNNSNKISNKKEIGSWVIGYWVPKENFEINVWSCFEHRFNRIYKAKKEQFTHELELKQIDNFQKFKHGNLLLIHESILSELPKLPTESIDYVITDPPHGDRLPYLELSLMWNDWLQMKCDFEKEIVVSDAKERHKDIESYNSMLSQTFQEIERVLKTDKVFTLIFNSLNDKAWFTIQNIIHDSKLELESIGVIGYSANSVVQDNRKRGLKTDFVINFKKMKFKKNVPHRHISLDDERELVRLLIEQYRNKNDSLETYKIMNFIISNLMNEKIFFNLSIILNELDRLTKKSTK